jgi:hypothetical protein
MPSSGLTARVGLSAADPPAEWGSSALAMYSPTVDCVTPLTTGELGLIGVLADDRNLLELA